MILGLKLSRSKKNRGAQREKGKARNERTLMGKRDARPLSARERAHAHVEAAEKYNDEGHIEKAVAHF